MGSTVPLQYGILFVLELLCTHSISCEYAECAELGILSVTGFRRQIGIQAQQDSYVTT